MRKIIGDLKIICLMLCFSFFYSYIFNERYYIIDTINILVIFTFSIYICSLIITFRFKKKYIATFYKHMTVAFLGIGIVSFSYLNLLMYRHNSIYFFNKLTQLNLFYSLYEIIILILALKNRKKDINFNIELIIVTLISMFVAYIAIKGEYNFITKNGHACNFSILFIFIKVITIILKIYAIRLLYRIKDELSNCFYLYLNIFLVCRICMHVTPFFKIGYIEILIVIINCILLAIADYCILKIMVVEFVMNPYTILYRNLIKKSRNINEGICELTSANSEEEKISMDYRRVKHEMELKNKILTNISHEFKTPVNVIYSAIQTQDLLKSSGKISEISKYNDIIKENCNRLIRLINNFIDSNRFYTENINVDFKCVNVVNLTERIIDSVIPYAKNKNINTIFDTSDEELYALVDIELYDRLVLNLVSNSIKFSKDSGNIKVYMNKDDDFIELWIEDDGIGINASDLELIFNKFERLDMSFSRETEGSGLGLHIVKGIVALLKGTIEITSKEGKGTKVKVIIPRYKCSTGEKIFDEEYEGLIDHKHEVKVEMSDIYL